ncbi:transporter substrate-binding domain-containing protein [Simiduia sp. 21SJ11W-1]|uniref:substrate-binding periplasmic protein n=1 Tax=Simiduia sp. 21SJ11W-1 TaxID=2909669 RepID=UPI0020A04C9E|nr:transporter substrate-binding domain-containing protein [Simiduia sp. 21SJ11W-1]UTA47081.1 transporter substrate-binding domain-containing protein [Simiduia sp. 21SJ11W-1]
MKRAKLSLQPILLGLPLWWAALPALGQGPVAHMAEAGPQVQAVTVGMGNFEPYFIAESQSGVFADIIRATFARIPNYEPAFVFGHSNKGLWASFEAGRLDSVANILEAMPFEACKSEPAFRFRDVAITLADSRFAISSVSDLSGKSIVTFEGAVTYFGESFAAVVEEGRYQEVNKPSLQAKMLYGGRYQVSAGDMFIFLHARKALRARGQGTADVVFHEIFPALETRMGFKDEALCKAFDVALAELKASGEYEAIYERHLNRLLKSGADH